jgi:hypothetical protein
MIVKDVGLVGTDDLFDFAIVVLLSLLCGFLWPVILPIWLAALWVRRLANR